MEYHRLPPTMHSLDVRNNLTLQEALEQHDTTTCSLYHLSVHALFTLLRFVFTQLRVNSSLGRVAYQPVGDCVSVGCWFGAGGIGGDVAGLQEAASDFID